MLDEPHRSSTDKSQSDPTAASSDDQSSGAASGQPRGWSRADREHLFIWVTVGFLVPGLLTYALHGATNLDGSNFTVQHELPTKALLAFFMALATWIVSRLEKRPLDDYGIPPHQAFGWRFWEGCVWGFIMLSAILLILGASGHFQIDSMALAGAAVFRYALGWSAVFLAVSISEEFTFRGYWLFSISKRLRFWPSALLLSLLFAAAHIPNHGENVLGILQVLEVGMLFCLTIRRTGNLWFAVGFHAAWDWAETFFYGVANSGLLGAGRLLNSSVRGPDWLTGGSAGPEGSILALLVLLLSGLLIHFRFPKAIYPDRPR
ncbi:MAG: lysostaphin resistance A-like protein [Candidatus Acidiferrum sp.]